MTHPGSAFRRARGGPYTPDWGSPPPAPSVRTRRARGPHSIPGAVMQGLTWWRGAPEAVTRGAASGGCTERRGENRGRGPFRKGGQETPNNHRVYYSTIISEARRAEFTFPPFTCAFYAKVSASSAGRLLDGKLFLRVFTALVSEITPLFLLVSSSTQRARSLRSKVAKSLLRVNSDSLGLVQRLRRKRSETPRTL